MSDKYSLFVPWKSSFGYKNGAVRLKHDYKERQFYFNTDKKPFLGLLNDGIASKFFIDAVLNESIDEAMIYVSRLSLFVNPEEIKSIFGRVKGYKYLISASGKNKGERINSVLITDNEKNRVSIIHFYMINEPDMFSKWKIYRIEKENVCG